MMETDANLTMKNYHKDDVERKIRMNKIFKNQSEKIKINKVL